MLFFPQHSVLRSLAIRLCFFVLCKLGDPYASVKYSHTLVTLIISKFGLFINQPAFGPEDSVFLTPDFQIGCAVGNEVSDDKSYTVQQLS